MNVPLSGEAVYFGEVSLSGAVRPVGHAAARLREAQKLGFSKAIVPAAKDQDAGAGAHAITQLGELVAGIAAKARANGQQLPDDD